MPFKSKAQQRFMFSQHPELAKEFADATPNIKALPEHVKKMAYGGETNPVHETLSAMENNPTAGFADGGMVDKDEPGLQDATVSDFLGPYLGGKAAEALLPKVGAALGGLGETGELTLGKAAPEMEGTAAEQIPKVTRFTKGIQKDAAGNIITKIEGVNGVPEEIAKLGYGPDPGSVPSHILDKFGIPEHVDIPMNAPNKYADGGEVKKVNNMSDIGTLAGLRDLLKHASGDKIDAQKADDIDPVVTSSDTAKGYTDGGTVTPYPTQSEGDDGLPYTAFLPPPTDFMSILKGAASDAMGPTTDVGSLAAARLAGSNVTAPRVNAENMIGMAHPNIPISTPTSSISSPQAQAPSAPPTSTPPSLSQAAQTVQNTPPTNPGIYQGISAEDRANLMKQLLAQKASGGNLAASGVGGLADAITSAFGKSPTNFQQNIRNTQNQNVANQIGVIDTERQQKMQDIQANIATQEADPNSPYSQGMRSFLGLQGMKVPSGMSAAMLKATLPDVTKIFDTKVVAATAAGAQGVEVAKTLFGETFADWLKESLGFSGTETGENYLNKRIGEGTAATRTTPNGTKYTVK